MTASQELWERTKSTLRMRYEAEARVIQKKIGDLESIRHQLGLTQRKICQLLLVDPSAWTRWTKNGETAPPHIYRALQWYLAVEEKYPALDTNFWLSTVAQVRDPEENSARDQRIQALGSDLSSMKGELEALRIQAAKAEELERELKALAIRSRRQNIAIMVAAVAGSLIAGLIASRFF
jgi:transcriptional regulator with XRE-family HTH domain